MRSLAAFCLLVLTAVFAGWSPSVVAADRPWYRYDSDFFEAYSDAKERDVRELLGELENFRRMVVTMTGIKVPDGAVKTQVVIFRSKRDFADTHPNRNVSAYMTTVTGIPYIVMPVKARGAVARQSIRHEYTHVLQAYNPGRTPPWYIEGFAEFMAGIEFVDKEDIVFIGHTTGRPISGRTRVDWDELVSDSFRFHQISDAERANNAYVQAWVLVHYLTLGDDMAHNEKLRGYLSAYARGASSSDAFYGMFGETAEDIGERALPQYQRGFKPVAIRYAPVDVDSEFVRSEAEPATIQRTVDGLKIRNGAGPD